MTVEVPWRFYQVVYLRTDPDPNKGMVTRYNVGAHGGVTVGVTWADRSETYHFAGELTTEFQPDYGADE